MLTAGYHLSGTKKIQQLLALPGVVEKYIKDPEMVKRIRSCFTGLYSLTDGDEGVQEIIQNALANSYAYVMKPQREGGGNLITKDNMKTALTNFSPIERSGYILMDRISPPQLQSFLVREGKIIETRAISELGIYCVFVGYALFIQDL
jgi:glutathione synthase